MPDTPESTQECDHRWGEPTPLPRGAQQQCSVCSAWRVVTTDGREVVLPADNVDRAAALLRTEHEIRNLPEGHE